jgi:roadblock/LC7 domain-containing protein
MKRWARWWYGLAGLVAAFVAVSSIVQAIRLGSWTPVISVGWLPAVIVAVWPGAYRRCLSPRR